MRKGMNKWLFLSCLCVFSISAFATSAFANTYGFDWEHFSGSYVNVEATDDQLNSEWNGTIFDNARNKWNGSAAQFLIESVSFSSSNLDIIVVDEQTWNDNDWYTSAYAWAQPWNNGSPCADDGSQNPDLRCSSADYGAIYINDGNTPTSASLRSALLAHEMGHIVGLAHTTSSTYSIMRGSPDSYFSYSPTTYDVNEFNNKY